MFTLHNGDCLQVMPSIPSGSIDAIITDLPYGTTACKWDTVIEFAPMWKEVKRVLKLNGAFITTASQPFTSALVMSDPKYFKQELIWDKVCATGALLAYKRIMKVHENIVLFYAKQCTFNPQYTPRKKEDLRPNKKQTKLNNPCKSGDVTSHKVNKHSEKYDDTRVNPKSIITVNKRSGIYFHATQKPVALYEYLIKTYTNEGETVLDIAMGSGTTIEAAERTGRNSIGIEKDEGIFQSAVLRLKSFTPSNKACSGQEPLAERFSNFD